MKEILSKYDLVVGLEVHVQLSTDSKLFVCDYNSFGDNPNSNVSPITLAHPGTLPKPNKKAIEYAIKMGIACNCSIARHTTFDRKNYFYPDLPKGYQTTQNEHPICKGGYLDIQSGKSLKRINFNRIHIEEDAGKSMHDSDHEGSLLDFNRAGTPLIEMVTEPEISTPEEAGNLLAEIRKIARFLDISDGNMEQGSLRCDANISLKPKGSDLLGKKVEIKNMNSIRNVQRAIQYEVRRQSGLLDKGKQVKQETRGFNDHTGETIGQRSKEEANDYRYFPCPDLLPIEVSEAWYSKIKASMATLPRDLMLEMKNEFGLKPYDTEVLTENKEIAQYFMDAARLSKNYKAIANWIMGPLKGYMNEKGLSAEEIALTPSRLAELIALTDADKVSFSIASTRIFPLMLEDSGAKAQDLAERLDLIHDGNENELMEVIKEVIDSMPDKANAYRNGKKGLLGLFMGEVMKKSKGKANPKTANKLIIDTLGK